ncbi:MAG: precorrin-3B C(17)-methyltransferase [Berryella intestinalis]|uniref:precorrin-3B C(17)-methyltransferase n=1 Tax=Berryella intestinalis TaxID=1531429 RepID=UPI002A56E255|nr:precorrin-3B C(17)-methyltransferase [Berryella intestinalis]MDD7369159.1 precorrin-3B C(17)-methyltransferase [Berryella intestinalis]MDY3128460.1 precorrin-3B C(17)-methyltransferase [Berryella intestinalis]
MALRIVGLGPGSGLDMTERARRALEASDLIVGYTVYVDLIRDRFPEKELVSTPMRSEVERCRAALAQAAEGREVAMVCSGDAGVYGMAGLCFELASDFDPMNIEVVAGVTAAVAGAAVLGAPLMHDFAVVSLSDLLTPWDTIASRLDAAARADFALCLYNPSSRKRSDYLRRACDILLESKDPATVCGYVRNIARAGEESRVLTLGELRDQPVDMFTTVFVGNSQTRLIEGRMVTPRGYDTRDAR